MLPHEDAESPHGQPSWEVVGGQQPEISGKKRGKRARVEMEDELYHKESSMQMALSYAGLVAALIVVLLGVIIMVGSSR